MTCENCETIFVSGYGSNRFCCKECLNIYYDNITHLSVWEKRNLKLSESRKHVIKTIGNHWDGKKHSKESRKKQSIVQTERFRKERESKPFCEIGAGGKKKILLQEQKYCCKICGLPNIWNNKKLVLEIDHIDGDHFNNNKDNLRMVCPNCHSQTPTYRSKNIKYRKVINPEFLLQYNE